MSSNIALLPREYSLQYFTCKEENEMEELEELAKARRTKKN